MPGMFGFINKKKAETSNNRLIFETIKKEISFFKYKHSCDHVDTPFSVGMISPHPGMLVKNIRFQENEFQIFLYGFIHALDGVVHDSTSFLNTVIASLVLNRYHELADLNGQFFLVVHNKTENIFFLVSDRFACEKTYLCETDDRIYFYPDFSATRVIPALETQLNITACIEHLYLTMPLDDNTLLNGVTVFPSATVFRISATGIETKKKYWEIDAGIKKPRYDIDTCSEQAHRIFNKAITCRLAVPGEKCLSLSGGLDSRTIAVTLHENDARIKCLTYGYDKSRDCSIAAEVSKSLDYTFDHVEIEPDYILQSLDDALLCTDGFVPGVQLFHLNAIKRYCQRPEHNPVMHFSGFYGDLTFGGSKMKSPDLSAVPTIDKVYKAIINRININFRKDELYQIIRPERHDYLAGFENRAKIKISNILGDLQNSSFCSLITKFYLEVHARRYLSTNSHFRFFAFDSKPFLDYDFFDFCISLPDDMIIGHNLYHYYLKKYHPELASLPVAATGKPVGIAQGKHQAVFKKMKDNCIYYLSRLSRGKINPYDKNNYIQLSKWLFENPEILKTANSVLLCEQSLDRKIFRRSGIKKLFEDHQKGKWTAEKIVNLFFIEKWFQKYLN